MADFPETLVGTRLIYFLPMSRPANNAPQGDVYPLDGTDFLLTFTTPGEANGVKVPDQLLEARFFDYVEKYITICKTGKGGFLSGPFSGCWFVRFFMNGAYHAAHIGTTGNVSDSQKVKKAFVDWASRTTFSQISCFNPKRAWTDAELLDFQKGSKGLYNLGYINADGACYSILLAKNADTKTLMTRSKVIDHFPTRPNLEKKPVWKTQAVNKYNPSREAKVGFSYTVVGVRGIPSTTWEHVRATEFPQ